MKPVNQSIFHDPSNNSFGDCYRACIASILELNIEDVPHFMLEHDWRKRIRNILLFLKKYNYTLYSVDGLTDYTLEGENEYFIVSGNSPRNKNNKHAVVGYKGKIVHDPHPDKTNIDTYDYSEIFLFIL
jgi:hypothetical protein